MDKPCLMHSDIVQIQSKEVRDLRQWGAFGALGGDFSAIEINPAASSIFGFSELGVTLNSIQLENTAHYFNASEQDNSNDLSIGQAGIVLILNDETGGDWSKISIAFNYNKSADFDNSFGVIGINPNRGIDQYFLSYAQGKRLDGISQLEGESFNDAYIDISEFGGYPAQQALFGYEGFVINPIPFSGSTDTTDPASNLIVQIHKQATVIPTNTINLPQVVSINTISTK